jgi:hypothetical protein
LSEALADPEVSAVAAAAVAAGVPALVSVPQALIASVSAADRRKVTNFFIVFSFSLKVLQHPEILLHEYPLVNINKRRTGVIIVKMICSLKNFSRIIFGKGERP